MFYTKSPDSFSIPSSSNYSTCLTNYSLQQKSQLVIQRILRKFIDRVKRKKDKFIYEGSHLIVLFTHSFGTNSYVNQCDQLFLYPFNTFIDFATADQR